MNFNDGNERPLMMGLTCPLLTNAEGVKMGKTEKGTLWVSREKTSPFEFFQHFINCLDADVERLLRFFTSIKIDEIKELCLNDIVKAKKIMAFEVTKLVHGEQEAIKALETSNNLFSRNGVDENMPSVELEFEGNSLNVIDFVFMSGLVNSKSEIRRLISQQGIELDGKKVGIDDEVDLNKKEFVLKKGKKVFLKVVVK